MFETPYGKAIAEKPDWLDIAAVTNPPPFEPEKDVNYMGWKRDEEFAADTKYTTVFAEEEAFKDVSNLLDNYKHSDEVAAELRRLKHKYTHWPNTVEVHKRQTAEEMLTALDARLISMGLMK